MPEEPHLNGPEEPDLCINARKWEIVRNCDSHWATVGFLSVEGSMTSPDHELHRTLLEHKAFLHRLARTLVLNEVDASDLEQETWLAALARPPAHVVAVRAWLGTIARRLAGRSARSLDRRRAREKTVARPEWVEDEEEAVDRRLDAESFLISSLRKLPDGQRVALSMRYADDLTPPEIADRLGVSVGTVKSRLRRGLSALRLQLDGQGQRTRKEWMVAFFPEQGHPQALVGQSTRHTLLRIWGLVITKVTLTKILTASAALLFLLAASDQILLPWQDPLTSGSTLSHDAVELVPPAPKASAESPALLDALHLNEGSERQLASPPPEVTPKEPAVSAAAVAISGRILQEGRPVSGATVVIYRGLAGLIETTEVGTQDSLTDAFSGLQIALEDQSQEEEFVIVDPEPISVEPAYTGKYK